MYLTSLIFITLLCSLNRTSHAFPLNPQESPKQPALRRRVVYSVVAVDGGSDATTSAAPVTDTLTLTQMSNSIKTVTLSASSTPPSIETIVVTNVVSELEPEKTMFLSPTQDITKSVSTRGNPSHGSIDSAAASSSSSTAPLTSYTSTGVLSGKSGYGCSTSQMITLSKFSWSPTATISVALANTGKAKQPEATSPKVTVNTSLTLLAPPPAITKPSTLPAFSKKTYDHGRWHTSYPFWNATSTLLSSASTTAVGTGRAQTPW